MLSIFHIPAGHLYAFYGEMSIQICFHFKIVLLLLFCYRIGRVPYAFWMLTLYHIYGLQMFSSIL